MAVYLPWVILGHKKDIPVLHHAGRLALLLLKFFPYLWFLAKLANCSTFPDGSQALVSMFFLNFRAHGLRLWVSLSKSAYFDLLNGWNSNIQEHGQLFLEITITLCYGLNVWSPQNLYVEALIPNIMVFGGGVFRGCRWGHVGETSMMGLMWSQLWDLGLTSLWL